MGKRVEVTVYKEISLELSFGAGNQIAQELFFFLILFKYVQIVQRLISNR